MTKQEARMIVEQVNSGSVVLPRVQRATAFRFSDGSYSVRLLDCDDLRVRSLRTLIEAFEYVGLNAR